MFCMLSFKCLFLKHLLLHCMLALDCNFYQNQWIVSTWGILPEPMNIDR